MIDDYEVNYLDPFAFIFSTNNVLVLLLNLAFVIRRRLLWCEMFCSRSPITIKSHDLDADDIRGVVDEIASYHEKD